MTRPPLNGMQPRTLREARRDPCDWISGPHQGRRLASRERAAGALLAVAIAVSYAVAVWIELGG
jgi:hypothetical protein